MIITVPVAASIEAAKQALSDSVIAAGNTSHAAMMETLSALLDPVLASPPTGASSPKVQAIATAMSELKLAFDDAGDTDLAQLCEELAVEISQTLVTPEPQVEIVAEVTWPDQATPAMLQAAALAWDFDPRVEDIEAAMARAYDAMRTAALTVSG